jgi:hypothetical protein
MALPENFPKFAISRQKSIRIPVMMEMVNVSWIVTLLAIIVLFFASSASKAYIAAFAVFVNSLITSWLAFPALNGQIVEFSIFAGTFLGDVAILVYSDYKLHIPDRDFLWHRLPESICKPGFKTNPSLVAIYFVSAFDGMGLHAAKRFRFPAGLGSNVADFHVTGDIRSS